MWVGLLELEVVATLASWFPFPERRTVSGSRAVSGKEEERLVLAVRWCPVSLWSRAAWPKARERPRRTYEISSEISLCKKTPHKPREIRGVAVRFS